MFGALKLGVRRCQCSPRSQSINSTRYHISRLFASNAQKLVSNASILHPLGNEKVTKYLENAREQYSNILSNYEEIDRALLRKKALLKQVLGMYDGRQEIVQNLAILQDEMQNEKDEDMLSMGKEEMEVRLRIYHHNLLELLINNNNIIHRATRKV